MFKKMGLVIKLILFTTIFQIARTQYHPFYHEVSVYTDTDEYEDEHTNNMCPETQEYKEDVVIPYNHTTQETKRIWCFSFSFRCSKTVSVTKVINKTISVLKTKTIFNCCHGYEKVNDETCEAVCHEGCVNGNCTEPNRCECDAGWEGLNCTQECEIGWYGKECDLLCNCYNGATCDRFNGTCFCIPGYTGKYCETTLDNRTTIGSCQCENGGRCGMKDFVCDCPPGYSGHYCEKECEQGTFGEICSGICTCDKGKTELCNPINGKCQCAPGWKGDKCDKPCEIESWGRHCDNKCDCGPNGSCHHVSGVCTCPPGWHGTNCEEKCPTGFFEKDCKMKCPECLHDPGTCHHETGWCNCPSGATGRLCHLECPIGYYGANCEEFCLCNNNSTCDPITGDCSCSPGWRGTYCSIPCPEGTYGMNCSFACNCSKTVFCDNANGNCTSVEELVAGKIIIDTFGEETYFPSLYINVIVGFFAVIFIALALTAISCKLSKKPYFSNFYQNIRTRFQRSHLFKTSELKKEDSSTTNVFQEDIPSVNPSSGQFTNPMYDATESIEKSDFRPTSTVHPIYGINEPNHDAHTTDKFEEVEFSIPESSLRSPTERPEIRISFGNDFKRCSITPNPVINFSSPGKTYFFPHTERKLPEHFENGNSVNEHRYENIEEDGKVKIPKE